MCTLPADAPGIRAATQNRYAVQGVTVNESELLKNVWLGVATTRSMFPAPRSLGVTDTLAPSETAQPHWKRAFGTRFVVSVPSAYPTS